MLSVLKDKTINFEIIIDIDYKAMDKLDKDERLKKITEMKQVILLTKDCLNTAIKTNKSFIKTQILFNIIFLLLAAVCVWFEILIAGLMSVGFFLFSIKIIINGQKTIEYDKKILEYVIEKEKELDEYIEGCGGNGF